MGAQDWRGNMMWSLFIPWLRWVPYGVGAAVGYFYGATGFSLMPAAIAALLFFMWGALR